MGALAPTLRRSTPRLVAARPIATATRPLAPRAPVVGVPRPSPVLSGQRFGAGGQAMGRSPIAGHPDDTERPSGAFAESAARAVSAVAPVSTEALRRAVQQVGAPASVVQAPRRVLVQALGASAVAKLSGRSAGQLIGAAGLTPAQAVAAGLERPDVVILQPQNREATRWGRPAFLGMPSGLGNLADAADAISSGIADAYQSATGAGREPNGSGSASAPPNPGSTPGAVPYRPGNWTADGRRYAIAPGDTMYGLSTTYLGLGGRWKEIWSLQSFRYTKCPDPSCTAARGLPMPQVGELLEMPAEAQEKHARWKKSSEVPKAPATPGSPGWGNDAPGRADDEPGGGSFWEQHKTKILVGAGALAVVGLVAAT